LIRSTAHGARTRQGRIRSVEVRAAGPQPCGDPECSGVAEPEQDGDCAYWACPECGYEFGYQLLGTGSKEDGSCQIGVPESIRRAASAPAQRAFDEQTPGVFIGQIGKRPQ